MNKEVCRMIRLYSIRQAPLYDIANKTYYIVAAEMRHRARGVPSEAARMIRAEMAGSHE